MRQLANLIFITLILSGCAATSDFKDPQVSLSKVELVGGDNAKMLIPEFEITLKVINPNDFDLEFKGLSYQIALNGEEVITGVANQLPIIKAYDEGEIVVSAKPDLFSGMSLLKAMMTNKHKALNYEVNVDLDPGTLYPNIKINKSGNVAALIGG